MRPSFSSLLLSPHSHNQKVFAFIVVESFYTTLPYLKGISP
jgi:hypothetical protein